jgi:HTH-type transcriptional regulator / antitoxin HigA
MAIVMRKAAEAFPPGEFLREELEARGWTQADLAEILDRPPRLVNEIIAAKRSITPETARGLGAAFGTSPELWMNLESAYQLWRERSEDTDAVSRRARLFSIVPIKEMQRRRWLDLVPDITTLERQVCDLLQIADLDEQPVFAHAARKATDYDDPLTAAQTAWIARAYQLAPAAAVSGTYSREALKGALAKLKTLVSAREEVRHVPEVLAKAGVRFLVIQPLQGTKIDGACFWVNDQPVIALSLRFDRIDNFWFVLLHELAHIGNADTLYLDMDLASASVEDGQRPAYERKADSFASEYLVSKDNLEEFIARVRPFYSTEKVLAFAQAQRVHPALIIGQLQHRSEIARSSFKKYMEPIREILVPNVLTDGWGVVPPTRS